MLRPPVVRGHGACRRRTRSRRRGWQCGDPRGAGINILARQCAAFDGGDDFGDSGAVGSGHFKVKSGLEGSGAVGDGAPV